MNEFSNEINDILNRMKTAYESGKGIRLTWENLGCLAVSIFGQAWNEPDPRDVQQAVAAESQTCICSGYYELFKMHRPGCPKEAE